MDPICQCGAQAGYQHRADCPYPLYMDDPDEVAKWESARLIRLQAREQNQDGSQVTQYE